MIKAVAFDMDGLMFDTEALMMNAWHAVGKRAGYEIPPRVVKKTIGLNAETTRLIFRDEYGPDFDYTGLRNQRIEWVAAYIAENGIPVKQGLPELLQYLQDANIPFTVTTSSSQSRTEHNLEIAGLRAYFTKPLVCNDAVKNGKPAPDIYLKAAEVLQVSPEDCIALEDSPMGILSAHRAGLKPIMIPDLVQPNAETQRLLYRQFASLSEVIPFLESETAKPQLRF